MNDYISVYFTRQNDRILRDVRCITCGRMLFKITHRVYAITNSSGIPLNQLPVDTVSFEHKCRGCEAYYKVYVV